MLNLLKRSVFLIELMTFSLLFKGMILKLENESNNKLETKFIVP